MYKQRAVLTKVYNGKRKYFYGKTKQERENKRIAYEMQMYREVVGSNTKLKDWIDIWYEVVGAKVTKATLDSYKNIVHARILPFWGELELDAINHIDVRSALSTQLASGYATRTVNYTLTLFKTILNQAVEDGVLATNPLSKIKKLKGEPPKEKIIINASQFNRLLSVIPSPSVKRMLNVAIRTGLRREELLGLRWSDIDYDRHTLTVRQTVIRQDNRTVIVNATKTKTSVRTIRISDMLVAMLKEQRKEIMRNRLVDGMYNDNNLVFANANGTPITPNNFSRLVVKYGKQADLPQGFSYYSLRHTHATMLLTSGATIKDVQSQLGHKTFSTTAQYLHSTPMVEDLYVNKIEGVLRGVDTNKNKVDNILTTSTVKI